MSILRDITGELLPRNEVRESSTAPKPVQVRWGVVERALEISRKNPWAQQINEEKAPEIAGKIINNMYDGSSVNSTVKAVKEKIQGENWATQAKIKQFNSISNNTKQLDNTAPMPKYDEKTSDDDLTENGVNIRNIQERIKGIHDAK